MFTWSRIKHDCQTNDDDSLSFEVWLMQFRTQNPHLGIDRLFRRLYGKRFCHIDLAQRVAANNSLQRLACSRINLLGQHDD